MASGEGNVILLTSQGEDGTLSRDLFEAWQGMQPEDQRYGSGKIGSISRIDRRVSLEVRHDPVHSHSSSSLDADVRARWTRRYL